MNDIDELRPVLSPSAIGQFFRLQSCPMYLQWEYDDDAKRVLHSRDWKRNELGLVLSGEGGDFEERQLQQLDDETRNFIGLDGEVRDETPIDYDVLWPDESDAARQNLLEVAEKVTAGEWSGSDVGRVTINDRPAALEAVHAEHVAADERTDDPPRASSADGPPGGRSASLELSDDELPGILNWALDGLDRLREQGNFTGEGTTDDKRHRWQ